MGSRGKIEGPTAAQFTVVLEDLRSKFSVFGEALQGLREEMTARFEQVDKRFEQVDKRFEQVGGRLESGETRIARIETDLGLVKTVVLQHGRELKEIRVAVQKLADRPDRAEVVAIVREVLRESEER